MGAGKGQPLIHFLKQSASLTPLLGKSTKIVLKWFPRPLSLVTEIPLMLAPKSRFKDLSVAGPGQLVDSWGYLLQRPPPESLGQQGLKRGHSPGSLP